MSDKISTKQLVERMAKHAGISTKSAAEFTQALQDVFAASLESHKTVKISGLGTFKLQWHAPRKSVDVRTGKTINISGHYRLTFVPENALKEQVNEPWAHLETVVLGEQTTIQGDSAQPNDNLHTKNDSESMLPPLQHLSEKAEDLKSLLSDIQGDSNSTPQGSNDKTPLEHDTSHEKMSENFTQSDSNSNTPINSQTSAAPKQSSITETPKSTISSEDHKEDDTQKPPIISEQPLVPKEPAEQPISETPQAVSTSNGNFVPPTDSYVPHSRNSFFIWLIIILLLLSGLCIAGLYLRNRIPCLQGLCMHSDTTALLPSKSNMVPDTAYATLAVKDHSTDSMTHTQTDTLPLSIFDQPRSYDSIQATITVGANDRLVLYALHYYGSKMFWVYIYEANRDVLANPNQLERGLSLRIPKLPKQLIDQSDTACINYAKQLAKQYQARKTTDK